MIMNDLADRFFAAVSDGDETTLTELYAPDARIWHNDDGREQTVTENLRVLRWLSRTLDDLRYEDIRRHELPDGFAQQHVLRATLPGHGLLEVPASLFVRVVGGRITRIDEYVDSAATQPLRTLAAHPREH
ncbi:ketosteroid isomerase-like protein [Rhodococcus wratislaviensis]|uniref:Ketosteroid isomerase-related protein n=2 Tax=Rhodococcus TaxID=1827 RepID=A0AB38F5M3_RHOWR|nr:MULTISPECIES: nuclear transport factor 2 family protein [Rhodococcus]REE70895.1 ketosteroid isomerase-like protein [Rhodococcus wratislaviensis]WAM14994.1 nuclear transport factor 2 family protein [Rhodococcus sp. JS3073]SPZ34618.1 Ketosteroid isomerase-related protein [Rhodococcus wratislaviensis]